MGSHVNENEKKSWKIKKKKKKTFGRTTEKKIQKKFERIQKWFEGGVAFLNIGSHVNENENIVKKWKQKISKMKKTLDIWPRGSHN